tara:strand:+ start:76 stop:243 length:168 start_codon:yes stop_codon:yes gene_type:complete
MLVQRMIVQAALKVIKKQFKLDKVLKYVEQPNELDEEVKRLRTDVELLKTIIKEK